MERDRELSLKKYEKCMKKLVFMIRDMYNAKKQYYDYDCVRCLYFLIKEFDESNELF